MNLPNQTKHLDPISPQEAILQMLMGVSIAQCIFVAAKLNIADLLKDGPKHCDELAVATQTHSNTLYRLLRALASIGIFSEVQPQYFQLTPLAACLQEGQPHSVRNFVLLQGELEYSSWGNLMYSLSTGSSAFEDLHGMGFFQYLNQNPTDAQIFARAMTEVSLKHYTAILNAYDFSSIDTVLDVGGGQGGLLTAILQHYPTLKGILFDQPSMLDKAKSLVEKNNLEKRCEFIAGNFFESIPVTADIYLLKNILHDWDDQKSIQILQNCRKSMTGKTKRLLVIEKVITHHHTPWRTMFADIKMLMILEGRTRTEEEFNDLFKSAGFRLLRVIPTETEINIIEGAI